MNLHPETTPDEFYALLENLPCPKGQFASIKGEGNLIVSVNYEFHPDVEVVFGTKDGSYHCGHLKNEETGKWEDVYPNDFFWINPLFSSPWALPVKFDKLNCLTIYRILRKSVNQFLILPSHYNYHLTDSRGFPCTGFLDIRGDPIYCPAVGLSCYYKFLNSEDRVLVGQYSWIEQEVDEFHSRRIEFIWRFHDGSGPMKIVYSSHKNWEELETYDPESDISKQSLENQTSFKFSSIYHLKKFREKTGIVAY